MLFENGYTLIQNVPTTFKNVQKGLNKSALAYELKPVFSQAWEKGLGDSQSADFDTISNKQFSPNLTTQWVKKCYSLLFSKYEIYVFVQVRIQKKHMSLSAFKEDTN